MHPLQADAVISVPGLHPLPSRNTAPRKGRTGTTLCHAPRGDHRVRLRTWRPRRASARRGRRCLSTQGCARERQRRRDIVKVELAAHLLEVGDETDTPRYIGQHIKGFLCEPKCRQRDTSTWRQVASGCSGGERVTDHGTGAHPQVSAGEVMADPPVVRDDHRSTRVTGQGLLQFLHQGGGEVIGRLVQRQQLVDARSRSSPVDTATLPHRQLGQGPVDIGRVEQPRRGQLLSMVLRKTGGPTRTPATPCASAMRSVPPGVGSRPVRSRKPSRSPGAALRPGPASMWSCPRRWIR